MLQHADHVQPWIATRLQNLRTACSDCNLGEGARRLEAGHSRVGSSIDLNLTRVSRSRGHRDVELAALASRTSDADGGMRRATSVL